ncbi:DUF2786 domain-containing protein [Methylomonas sp. SURF-1]|uniref:DUF2786 domain-containing protein n=1 Tax=Methylomonas aurea TaxID=2952224 RepID=A0ABT1UKI0_9GAMM|nr:DUF2786 domain-containing protein [Methylomonas sp. SURF-1]MCQ8182180.1 DUF2786 domain-containing protein [Methylomonas sp. SURF-1]
MTPEELKKIADKIAKCMALAASDNPAEAEAAKRQADALMKKYNLTSGDVAAAAVHEEYSDTKSVYRPPVYLCGLANIIADAFGCHAVVTLGLDFGFAKRNTRVKFMGLGIKPELAAYTFDVLRRLITRDRAKYAESLRKNLKRDTKIRRADLFCQAWVAGIAQQVRGFAGSEAEQQAIEAYKAQKFGENLKTDQRSGAEAKHGNDWKSEAAGFDAAKDVSLHKPVQAKRGALLGTCR